MSPGDMVTPFKKFADAIKDKPHIDDQVWMMQQCAVMRPDVGIVIYVEHSSDWVYLLWSTAGAGWCSKSYLKKVT
jgi:hypothetical protein